jgi:hypothetical protein
LNNNNNNNILLLLLNNEIITDFNELAAGPFGVVRAGLSEPLFRQPANTKELQDLRYNLNKGRHTRARDEQLHVCVSSHTTQHDTR